MLVIFLAFQRNEYEKFEIKYERFYALQDRVISNVLTVNGVSLDASLVIINLVLD